MEVSEWTITTLFSENEPLSDDQVARLMGETNQSEAIREKFREFMDNAVSKQESSFKRDPVMALKAALGYLALGMHGEALSWLEKAGDGKQPCYFRGCCLRGLGRYEEAIQQFEQAETKGCDSFDMAVAIVDCLRRGGDLEGAAEKLKRLSRVGDIRAEYHYQLGRLHEANGSHEESIDEYERAIQLDANHREALFHLAYVCDLYGLEDKAMEYYQQCIAHAPAAPVSALMNLAVLHEDKEEYYSALRCVMQVLAAYPNHARARMFQKDIESSLTMYYDEDQERRIDRRNKVLEIPISDFELSVRSRNCLKKMNIKTLGDLLRVTESELLAYKNFGETSLQEIKTVLNAKGLRLGQMLEDPKGNGIKKHKVGEPEQSEGNEVMEKPVSELTMSVRSRKCLERLNINSIGELVQCTEAELLGCKNFGMTSLNEIKTGLKEHNLLLRRLED